MPECLECGTSLTEMTNEHLVDCCGLTLQEYALRHCLSLDILVPERLINTLPDVMCIHWRPLKPVVVHDSFLVQLKLQVC